MKFFKPRGKQQFINLQKLKMVKDTADNVLTFYFDDNEKLEVKFTTRQTLLIAIKDLEKIISEKNV